MQNERLERMMQIVFDLKKETRYIKSEGCWYWRDRDDESVGPDDFPERRFPTFLEAVQDICAPYLD